MRMTVFRWSLGAGHALLLALAFGTMAPAAAVPLEAPACAQLQVQYDALRLEGAADDMARGPEWARTNLPADRLQRIGLLLEVEEKLNFRCGLAKITLPTTIEGGEEEVPGPGEATIEGSGRIIVLPRKAPPSPGGPRAAAAAVAPANAGETKPAAAKPRPKKRTALPKKKPQPRLDDAYRPGAAGASRP